VTGNPHPPASLLELRVAPSILSADFARLGAQVDEVLAAGARVIHVDVMDGHFVPPITFGALIVGALADQVHGAGAIIDVHLMIERPERQVAEFARAGADNITVHAEATLDLALCMSVNPGWSAQRFIPASVGKLKRLRAMLPRQVALEVDGGIHESTAGKVTRAGANVLVTGSGVFGSVDPAAAYSAIAAAASAA
jgi:ribulose-phosphate 3-epimerase